MTNATPTPPAPHPLLTPEALAAMYAHARRDYPNECCGIVFGPRDDRAAGRAVACVNIQNELHAEDPVKHARDARTAYNLGAGDLFKLQKSLRGAEPAKIVYHSHVDVGAYFSETDQAAAQMDGEPSYPVEYVVIDVRADGAREAAQFAWDAGQRKYVEVGRYDAGRYDATQAV
jgi:adenylyltransferase/sulfurtransferase